LKKQNSNTQIIKSLLAHVIKFCVFNGCKIGGNQGAVRRKKR